MCGMATFTIEVAISSSTAASVTAMAIRYLYLYLSSVTTCAPAGGPERSVTSPDAPSRRMEVVLIARRAWALPGGDVRDHRHAGTERPILAKALGHANADRHTLHDLREVAGRVVRREQRELGAGRRADALHLALRRHAAVRVDLDLDVLADAQVVQLRLLEVRRDPHAGVGHDGEERLPRLHQLAHLDLLPRHDAGHRGRHSRVGELKRCIVARRLCRTEAGHGQ